MSTEQALAQIKACLRYIEAQTAGSKDTSTHALLDQFSELTGFHKALIKLVGEKSSVLSKIRGTWKEKLIPERFDEEDTTSINDAGFRFTVSPRQRCGLINDLETAQLEGYSGKLAGMEWLKQHGGAAIVTETVNANTLSSWAAAEMGEGRELPDDLFRTYMFETTSMTKVEAK